MKTAKPGTPINRSLERGLEVLRSFRPGIDQLGNGELAERTGLSRSTVSRLTQTLVSAGMLLRLPRHSGYALAPAVLSLSHAMRSGSAVLQVASPLMRALAESRRINVGLAAPDRDEMVYLESIRYSRRQAFRNVVSGQRVPIELTSLGRAYLASIPEADRRHVFAVIRRRRKDTWSSIRAEIDASICQVREHGFCAVSWQPDVAAIAAPLEAGQASYVVNISVSTGESVAALAAQYAQDLLGLARAIREALNTRSG